MKNLFMLMLLASLMLFSSCQKDDSIDRPKGDYFVSFQLDGTPVELRAEACGVNSNPSGIINSTLVNIHGFNNSNNINKLASIDFNFDKSLVSEADIQALVGQKIEVGARMPGLGLYGTLSYDNIDYDGVNGTIDFQSGSTMTGNLSSDYYIKVNSVALDQNIFEDLGKRMYVLEGEFNLTLHGADNVVREANNGRFRLLFPLDL